MIYAVTVNFAGFIGCDMEYDIEADSVEEAEELAIQEAIAELSVEVEEVKE